MRISDWSSDVCSSDLCLGLRRSELGSDKHRHLNNIHAEHMAGQGAGKVKRDLKPGFLAGIVMNQKPHVLHLRLPRISFRHLGRYLNGMEMRSLRTDSRLPNTARSEVRRGE